MLSTFQRIPAWQKHSCVVTMTLRRGALCDAPFSLPTSTIAGTDAKLRDIYRQLYQSTIDFGGHPNERGLSSNLLKNEEAFLGVYLSASGLAVANCFKSVALAGLTCLNIFQHIF
jgi:hypothetical protein